MTNAEKIAYEEFPTETFQGETGDSMRFACMRGYRRAEKEMTLTWQDMASIVVLADTILDGNEEEWRELGPEAYYSAVLDAFNRKRRTNMDCKDCVQKCIHRKWGKVCEYYATAEDRVLRLKEEDK